MARLINGGCKTRVYLVKLGGFDTHNNQVINGDTSYGNHAALLYHFSNAIKAFMDDLASSGKDEEVVLFSFSEFGRRPYSNGSVGTDHGTAGPMFVVGTPVQPGVIGIAPDLVNTTNNGNLLTQYDYRQIFTTLLSDWMGACDTTISDTLFGDFLDQKLPLISDEYNVNVELPIELSWFRGWNDNDTHFLEWATATEINTDFFEVMRSTDGESFQAIGRTQAAGNSQNPLVYRFEDISPEAGTNYYRIRQVDQDGAFTFTHIISILNRGGAFSYKLFPNPIRSVMNLNVVAPENEPATITIWDAAGKRLLQVPVSLHEGMNRLSPPVQTLPEGNYTLEMRTSSGNRISEQFVKLAY